MVTPTQQKAIYVATIAAAVFGGIQLWPSIASLYKVDPPANIANTASAPGGVAMAGVSLGALPVNGSVATQITINNSDRVALEFLKEEIIGRENQKQVAQSLEMKLADNERSLQDWQFWYFHGVHPLSIEMLKDLGKLQNYPVRKADFDVRWATIIQVNETRSIYINDVLLRYGWVTEQNGLLSVSARGLRMLKQSGLYVAPYAVARVVSPSFDCSKAEKNYEKIICSDEELALLDIEMVRLFKHFQSPTNLESKLINGSQVDWRNQVRNVCLDRNCLVASYNGRIRQLKSAGAQ